MAGSGGRMAALLLLYTWAQAACAQEPECGARFSEGRGDFVLNTLDSVKDGATYLSNPDASTRANCTAACCAHAHCNLVLVQQLGGALGCFLFDCMYRNRFVCSFSRRSGFSSHILHDVFHRYLAPPDSEEDRHPIANAGTDLVIRAGERAELNGIESWDDKNITKYEWRLLKGNSSVVMERTEFPDQRLLTRLQPGVYTFQLTVTDSADQSDSTSVTVLVLTPEQAERHCLTPMKSGPCRGAFPRWYFNAASGACMNFVFGGCKPNSNNYLSENECKEACNGTTVVPHGTRKLNTDTEVCGTLCGGGQFMCRNGCCVDSSLECDGVKQCSDGSDEENCQRLNMTLSQLLEIDVNKGWCVMPPVTGPCRAHLKRWFYDPIEQSCSRFTYGGCGGNANNFEKRDDCTNSCKGITDSNVFARGLFERFELELPDNAAGAGAGSVTVGLIVVLCIFAVIAVVSCWVIKTRKKKLQNESTPANANANANPPVPLTEETRTLI